MAKWWASSNRQNTINHRLFRRLGPLPSLLSFGPQHHVKWLRNRATVPGTSDGYATFVPVMQLLFDKSNMHGATAPQLIIDTHKTPEYLDVSILEYVILSHCRHDESMELSSAVVSAVQLTFC